MSTILFCPGAASPASTFKLVTLVVKLLVITPSTTYKGSEDPLIVLGPLSLMEKPPAGSPEFWVICAPGTLPCRDVVIFAGEAFTNSTDFTVVMALPNFFLDWVTDEPTRTTSSKAFESSIKVTLIV